MSTTNQRETSTGTMVAQGGVMFAATMMFLIGLFQFFQGLGAIISDDFYVSVANYAFEVDITAWGWIHLIIGVIIVVAAFYLLTGSAIAGGVAIGLASLSAVANFFFIPYFPIWALLIIAMNIFVIWAIVRAGMLTD